MRDRSPKSAFPITAACLMLLIVCHSSFSNAGGVRRTTASSVFRRLILAAGVRAANPADPLLGEWRVSCEVKTYQNGKLQDSVKDEKESLVVAESDPDGSFYLYKFPVGFGEAVPRLRKVGQNRYEGADTVKGIEYTVTQTVQIDGDGITLSQSMFASPGRQLLSETTGTGSRVRGEMRIGQTSRAPDTCQPDPVSGELPDKTIARRYKAVRPFSDGLAAVASTAPGSRELKWGFIDKTGRVVIPARYDVVSSFHDGLASVGVFYGRARNLKWGIIETLGPQVTPHVNFDAVKILGGGFAAVGYIVPGRPGLKWNLTNREYTLILHGFDEIGCFADGQARASYTEDGVTRSGYIDRVGVFVAQK